MAITVAGSGTQSPSDNTEVILYSTSSSGHYTATIDLTANAGSDDITIRFYKKVLTGSSYIVIDYQNHVGAVPVKDGAGYYVPHVSCPFGMKLTFQQNAGTLDNSYEWSVEYP